MIADQKPYNAHDIIDGARTSERRSPHDLLQLGRVHICDEVGFHIARRDRVDCYAATTELARKRTRHCIEATLRRRVSYGAFVTAHADNRTYGYDRTAAGNHHSTDG